MFKLLLIYDISRSPIYETITSATVVLFIMTNSKFSYRYQYIFPTLLQVYAYHQTNEIVCQAVEVKLVMYTMRSEKVAEFMKLSMLFVRRQGVGVGGGEKVDMEHSRNHVFPTVEKYSLTPG